MPELPPFGLLRLPAEIRFGVGAAGTAAAVVERFGRRVLLCTDRILSATPAFRSLHAELEGRGHAVLVLDDVQAELPLGSVLAAAELARGFGPDVVVGYGGGSALDLAKLVALLVSHPRPVADFYGENRVPGPVLPVVAIPTTAGTGSEVTPVAVLSDPDRALKVGVSDPALIPRAAVVDPQLTVGAPPAVTAHSGIDAFVHAVESFTASGRFTEWPETLGVFVGRNRLSSGLALDAVRLVSGSLRTAVTDGSDLAARTDMALGSLYAGMAFGTAGTHLSHAIQYPVGTLTRTPHGLGTGLLLPFVLEACAPAIGAELVGIGTAMGLPDPSVPATLAAVRALVADIGIPGSLAELGMQRTDLPRVVELSLGVTRLVGNAPLPGSAELVTEIVTAAFEGRPARALA
ncbi:iron-containing alcohol dehydrogenase [Blastococcus tunisiensis]|uniref:Alcohol dehydrogenase n=1 Tax=Blastococcus tunisiensis TaxID=1798228 RepID=A0A1I1WL98_9ACTN|nr:iron-containing alcohol dehydrogenase [Blastococcus sp. DSM 46838]SFD95751.1 alcohol dehydrogenase [Blastococcus sp. DSM 46838]